MAGDSVFLHHDTGISVFHAGLSHCSHYSYHYVPAPDYLPAGTMASEKGKSIQDGISECGDDCLFCHMLRFVYIKLVIYTGALM